VHEGEGDKIKISTMHVVITRILYTQYTYHTTNENTAIPRCSLAGVTLFVKPAIV